MNRQALRYQGTFTCAAQSQPRTLPARNILPLKMITVRMLQAVALAVVLHSAGII
jgi:hypothetical protein